MTHALKPVVWGLWLSAEKLAKFDSSQVCSEMPFFKRQKEGEAFALDSCVPLCVCMCVCVSEVFLSCDGSSKTTAIVSICYADHSSDPFVYCFTDCIHSIYTVFSFS